MPRNMLFNQPYDERHSVSQQLKSDFLKGCSLRNVYKISQRRMEPKWMMELRKKGFFHWLFRNEPHWCQAKYHVDYRSVYTFFSPKRPNDPFVRKKMLDTFKRLGVSPDSRIVATDGVWDSVSVFTSHKQELEKQGIIFCSISEACKRFPEIVQRYIGTVVPFNDNYFAALNTAFFSDGTFVYVPRNVRVPFDLSSYFRIDSFLASQFERTLIIAEEGSFVNYLEGCSAPANKMNQLHAAVVEIVAHPKSVVNYFTLQNWFSGKNGRGGIYNFVTKRARCMSESEVNWLQVEVGSAITWKYPSCILEGNDSRGSFHSISLSSGHTQVDTGTKMIHIGDRTKSFVNSKSLVFGNSSNTFRSKVEMKGEKCNAFSRCDSMMFGDRGISRTLPLFRNSSSSNSFSHEASLTRPERDAMHFLECRGMNSEEAHRLMIRSFTRDVVEMLPEEFYAEVSLLLDMKFDDNV